MLRNILRSFIVVLVSASGLFAASVSIVDFQFTPGNLTIAVGTSVTWTNNGSTTHTVTSGTPGSPSGLFDSGNRNPGQTFTRTFTQPGIFPYFCRIHTSMTATITVVCANKAQLLKNPGFELGNMNWVASAASIINNTATFPAHNGNFKAQLNGKGTANKQNIFQQVSIPSNACSAKLTFFLRVSTLDGTNIAHHKLKVQILDTSGNVLKTLKTFSNLHKSANYVKRTLDVLNFKGQTVRVRFLGIEDSTLKTTFLVDDATIDITKP